jgi:biotin--protein ligase
MKEGRINKKRWTKLLILTGFLPLLLLLCCDKLDETNGGNTGATIALYNDRGVDDDCLTAALHMFQWMEYSIRYITSYDINSEGLDNYKLLCIPGGDMYQYGIDITSTGKKHIKDFIDSGGGYIGICGGGYFAAETVIWRGNQLSMSPLGIFSGTTQGPIDQIVPYPDYGMCTVTITDTLHAITESEPGSFSILYYWGPEFIPNNNAQIETLGTYDIEEKVAIIAFSYGSGRIFLTGPHPEFEENDTRDGTTLGDELDDPESEWELMKKATRWCLKEIN